MIAAPLSWSALGGMNQAERRAFNIALNLAVAAVQAWDRDGARDVQDLTDALSDMKFI